MASASVVVISLLYLLSAVERCSVRGARQTYLMTFMNITTDREEEGFIQIFGFSINQTQMIVEGRNDTFNQFKVVQASKGSMQTYNYTPTFDELLREVDPVPEVLAHDISNLAIVVSSNEPVFVVGVKSDKGSTDASMALPVVESSKEFMIAGWQKTAGRDFLVLIMVAAARDDTCVEVYKIFGGSRYVLVGGESIGSYQMYRYFAHKSINEDGSVTSDVAEDVTGYYVNTTKPVAVYFGHECAWVPTVGTLFCDYMVEQIPPIDQLGERHVVPPLIGRSAAAGYVIRVVPSQPDTVINIPGESAVTKTLGEFLEYDQPVTNRATLVTCDKPCLVMQYNKGHLTVPGDTSTDPYMSLVPPDDRWTAGAGFATANFCEEKHNLIEFANFMTIVTFDNYKDDIRFDDQPIVASNAVSANRWTEVRSGPIVYAVTSFSITHGFHYVNLAPGTFGSFAVFVYGHSPNDQSTSGYGYSANYNITGMPLVETYPEALKKYRNEVDPLMNATCSGEEWLTGSILTSAVGQYVPMPFTLYSSISPAASLSAFCRIQYNSQLMKLLQDFSRKINHWICMSKNCSMLNGQGVALEYSTLKVTWLGTAEVYTGVEIYVNVIASLDVTAQQFARCRAEIRHYMMYFINWPPSYIPNLIDQTLVPDCPWPLDFTQPQFTERQQQCDKIF